MASMRINRKNRPDDYGRKHGVKVRIDRANLIKLGTRRQEHDYRPHLTPDSVSWRARTGKCFTAIFTGYGDWWFIYQSMDPADFGRKFPSVVA
jgi:hypothetical protein